MKRPEKISPVRFLPAILLFLAVILTGCGAGDESEQQPAAIEGEGISVEGSWVRPAQEGRMSAGYFLITNFEGIDDTLTGISSGAAELTEIHESYEREEGMMGMREVPELTIPAQSTVSFEPGGLHIMFIQVTQSIEEGDQVEVTLHFANYGDLAVELPVRQ